MNDFRTFAALLAAQFTRLSQHELFVVDLAGDDVWQAYLAAFPEGTNPIYRVRTEHDGSYDRNFVRKVGNVVALVNGQVQTIWDLPNAAYPYNEVCAVLAAKVRAAAIVSVFRSKETKLGYESTVERLEEGATHRWYHFHADIHQRHCVASVGEAVGEVNTKLGVYQRALTELKLDAIDAVIDLASGNNLYRGAEFLPQVSKLRTLFLDAKNASRASDPLAGNHQLWASFTSNPASVTLLRNTAIGTLLVDLSEGVDLEAAVRAFESKVAPTNYRRTTALITPRMVEEASKTLADLGLEPALERRFATLADVSVNNVLWVNNDVQDKMKDGIAGLLANDVSAPAGKVDKAVDISVDEFMRNVLPKVSSLEALVTNRLSSNLASLTAPVHPDAPKLFKWDNGFGWSYNGNITDSIKERVKAAGGNVNAKLRVSLAWFNHDDLDLHAECPDGHVFYAAKDGQGRYGRGVRNGQILDVDMNAGHGTTRTPVENLSWVDPQDGTYRVWVNQFSKRETSNVGFVIEIDGDGAKAQFSYDRGVSGDVEVFSFTVRHGRVENFKVGSKSLVGGGISQEKWELKTETFVKVNTLLLSPNHWDDQAVGNKHWFFVLDGCVNDEPTRGIYNEFLRPELDKHRKVFEVLGNRAKCQPTPDQLSGLGFSSTQRNTLTVRAKGKRLNALYNVNF